MTEPHVGTATGRVSGGKKAVEIEALAAEISAQSAIRCDLMPVLALSGPNRNQARHFLMC